MRAKIRSAIWRLVNLIEHAAVVKVVFLSFVQPPKTSSMVEEVNLSEALPLLLPRWN